MANLEENYTPLSAIVRRSIEATYEWSGEVQLQMYDRDVCGNGSISANVSGLSGTLEVDQTRADRLDFPDFASSGTILSADRYGTARPLSGAQWLGTGATITGISLYSSKRSYAFKLTGELLVPAEASDADCYWRYVYQGAGLPIATLFTEIRQDDQIAEYRRDRFAGTFRGRHLQLRHLTDSTDPARSFVAAVHDGAALSENEMTGLWLLVSFISGGTARHIYRDSFSNSGDLLQRTFRLGATYSERFVPPFSLHANSLSENMLEALGNGFVNLLELGFPIAIVLDHLHSANTGNPEIDAVHLFLALQAAIEGFDDSRNNSIISDAEWHTLRSRLVDSARPILAEAEVPVVLFNNVIARLSSANAVSATQRQRRFFSRLGIGLKPNTEHALKLRNEIFHFGYFKKRFAELSMEDKQARIDLPGILRNVINVIVLRLVNYDGFLIESTRHGAIRIEAHSHSSGVAVVV